MSMVRAVGAGFAILAALAATPALAQSHGAFSRPEFEWMAPQGFGDRDNSQSWSMIWFNGAVLVGTGRATYCVQQATLELFQPVPDPYPPDDQDVICPPDPHDIPLRAEIWRWTPDYKTWTRVYQSPNDVPILGTTKFTARDIGYRGMTVFPEPQPGGGFKDVLYVSGVSSRAAQGIGINGPVPPPRLLRSEDGINFEAVPQARGTFLGDTLVSGFRSMEVYNGKLYILASVGLLGHGVVFESAQPWLGNNAFRQVTPPGMLVFEIETYENHLWVGTGGQPINGDPPFALLKTNATGEPPYTFTEIIPPGGYSPVLESAAVISLQEFKRRLFVGTERELIRVNPDDTWDLLVGIPRATPLGYKTPVADFHIGFDNPLNIHMWRMAVDDDWLYIATQDQSTKWRNLVGVGEFLEPNLGFDMFATHDGWHFTRISRDGFGDFFNAGGRSFVSTPHGFFLGTANHYHGLQVYRARRLQTRDAILDGSVLPRLTRSRTARAPLATNAPAAPKLLEIDELPEGVLISWERVERAVRFRVYRDSWLSDTEEIGVVDAQSPAGWVFIDTAPPPPPALEFLTHYFVKAEDAGGGLSAPSNIGRAPLIGFVATFASVRTMIEIGTPPISALPMLDSARALFERASYLDCEVMLGRIRDLSWRSDRVWYGEDVDVALDKLIRRVRLTAAGLIPAEQVLE